MSKTVDAPSVTTPDAPVASDDLQTKLKETLATLAHIDHAYEWRRAMLEERSLSQGRKQRLQTDLEKLHQQDREPLLLRLADLHHRIMLMRLFRTVH